jgi:hypothetical protein
MEAKPKVRKEELLDWLFSDSDDAKQLGVRIIRQLHDTGSATITIQELFDECGYIPAHILLNEEEFHEDDEFEPSEVELIS